MSISETESPLSEARSADEWGQYRSMSTMAVVAFVLGLCSLLVFASPLLLVVPLAAIAAALLALRAIAASEGGLSGAGLARCGLALAILLTVASVARVKVRDALLEHQVDAAARQWLTLAQTNQPELMLKRMTRASRNKVAPALEIGKPMPFFGGILASALVRHDPLLLRLADVQGTDASQLKLVEADASLASNPPQGMVRYAAGHGDAWTCRLILNRYSTADGEAVWLVDSWELE